MKRRRGQCASSSKTGYLHVGRLRLVSEQEKQHRKKKAADGSSRFSLTLTLTGSQRAPPWLPGKGTPPVAPIRSLVLVTGVSLSCLATLHNEMLLLDLD